MRARGMAAIVAVALVSVAVVAPATAHAATIVVNKGVNTARLGMKDTTAAKRIGKVKKYKVDRDYQGSGKTYYIRYFGTKSGGHYSVVMYSNSKHKVNAFMVYSAKYKTSKGIRVGSTVAKLKSAYGSKLKYVGGAYRLKASTGSTYFNTKSGKVTSIWVWRL